MQWLSRRERRCHALPQQAVIERHVILDHSLEAEALRRDLPRGAPMPPPHRGIVEIAEDCAGHRLGIGRWN